MKPNLPNLEYEKQLWQKDYLVIGVDEVGRGALVGSVTAAACLFSNGRNFIKETNSQKIKISDSKKLTPNQRFIAHQWIKKNCLACGFGGVGVNEINKIGIAKASIKAMRRAIKQLKTELAKRLNNKFKLFVLSDYFYIPHLKNIGINQQKPIVHGDEISFSIAAASIIAKVERDRLMVKLAKHYPLYKWAKNKGYGTLEHRNVIIKYGITKYHRTHFVRDILKT
jgi:ribonuclease HII